MKYVYIFVGFVFAFIFAYLIISRFNMVFDENYKLSNKVYVLTQKVDSLKHKTNNAIFDYDKFVFDHDKDWYIDNRDIHQVSDSSFFFTIKEYPLTKKLDN